MNENELMQSYPLIYKHLHDNMNALTAMELHGMSMVAVKDCRQLTIENSFSIT